MNYVFAGYLVVFATLSAYTWRVLARQRSLARLLHSAEGSGNGDDEAR